MYLFCLHFRDETINSSVQMNPTCQLAAEFVHLPIIGNYRPFANIVLFTVDIGTECKRQLPSLTREPWATIQIQISYVCVCLSVFTDLDIRCSYQLSEHPTGICSPSCLPRLTIPSTHPSAATQLRRVAHALWQLCKCELYARSPSTGNSLFTFALLCSWIIVYGSLLASEGCS